MLYTRRFIRALVAVSTLLAMASAHTFALTDPSKGKKTAKPLESDCPEVEAGVAPGDPDPGDRGWDYHCECRPGMLGFMNNGTFNPTAFTGHVCRVFNGAGQMECSVTSHCADNLPPSMEPFRPEYYQYSFVPTYGVYGPCDLRPFGC